MTTKEMIEVMAAFDRGEKIEYYDGGEWIPAASPIWDWHNCDYRIAPKPEPRPFRVPEGVFWMKAKPEIGRGTVGLCVAYNEEAKAFFFFGAKGSVTFAGAAERWLWSHDRKTWFTFQGEEVK